MQTAEVTKPLVRPDSVVDIQPLAITNIKRKPSLSIKTNGLDKPAENGQSSAPLPPSPPTSPSVMNPLQRLSNLASLMVYTLWFDIPLVTLLADWNLPGNRYFKFKSQCEKVLASTRLSPSVVVVGLKYLQRVKKEITRYTAFLTYRLKQMGQYAASNEMTPFPTESIIWASCLLLSHKYLDDKHYSNPIFAGVNSITSQELKKAEMECLRLLDFNLAILEEEYVEWRKYLQSIVTDSIKSIAKPSSSAGKSLLHPKKPYQKPPVSPGILQAPATLWAPDSPLVLGGALRIRENRTPVPQSAGIVAPPRSSSFRNSARTADIEMAKVGVTLNSPMAIDSTE